MKKLENFGRKLSKEEQRNLMGGNPPDEGGTIRTGYCINSVGCWHYQTPVYHSTCQTDIAIYCSSGQGACISLTNCPS